MDNSDQYQSWLEKKRQVEPSSEFSKNVLTQISLYEEKQTERRFKTIPQWLEWISMHPIIQTAFIIAGVLLGAVRMAVTLRTILSF